MKRASIFALSAVLALNPMLGCATFSADAAIVQQKISANAAAIQSFCDTKVVPASTVALGLAAVGVADKVPYADDFTLAVNSAVATCKNVEAVANSLTTLPWLQSLLPVIQAVGKIAAPPVIKPAPVTSTSTLPSV